MEFMLRKSFLVIKYVLNQYRLTQLVDFLTKGMVESLTVVYEDRKQIEMLEAYLNNVETCLIKFVHVSRLPEQLNSEVTIFEHLSDFTRLSVNVSSSKIFVCNYRGIEPYGLEDFLGSTGLTFEVIDYHY